MGKSVKIGGLYIDESARNMTFDEFKDFIKVNDLGKVMLIDVQKAYDILQGCEGCDEKKEKVVKRKRKSVKKKP